MDWISTLRPMENSYYTNSHDSSHGDSSSDDEGPELHTAAKAVTKKHSKHWAELKVLVKLNALSNYAQEKQRAEHELEALDELFGEVQSLDQP